MNVHSRTRTSVKRLDFSITLVLKEAVGFDEGLLAELAREVVKPGVSSHLAPHKNISEDGRNDAEEVQVNFQQPNTRIFRTRACVNVESHTQRFHNNE
jgi:hypothetical protein